jgi:hypothetical protein
MTALSSQMKIIEMKIIEIVPSENSGSFDVLLEQRLKTKLVESMRQQIQESFNLFKKFPSSNKVCYFPTFSHFCFTDIFLLTLMLRSINSSLMLFIW